jgi:hypothetical protein
MTTSRRLFLFFFPPLENDGHVQGLPSCRDNAVHFFYFSFKQKKQRCGFLMHNGNPMTAWIGKEKTCYAASGGPRAHELGIQIEKVR